MTFLSNLLRDAPAPGAAIEIAVTHVSGIIVERRGAGVGVTAHAREALPPGSLVPDLGAANVRDRQAVASTVDRVLERLGRPRRVGLVVPDQAARVSIVTLDKVPVRLDDLDQVLRGHLRKAVPFSPDDAQVAWAAGSRGEDGHRFVVVAMKRDVVAEYESLCGGAGAYAGLVDLATFNVANAVMATPPAPAGDWLLVRAAGDAASVAILRGADLIFFRSRGEAGIGTLADLVHQTAMYYEDRLGGTRFERVVISGLRAADADAARIELQARLGVPVTSLDVRETASVGDRITTAPALVDELAPLVGLLLRDKVAA